jgi:biotin transport system substrate-specific component
VTLQTAFVLLAALLLTPGWAAASISLYLLLGVAGLPVFAGGVGGPAGLVGPTAGFLIAFPVAALVGSALFHSLTFRKRRPAVELAIAVVAVLAAEGVIYVMGVSWLQWQANISLAKALSVALVPFIVPDALKATIAVVVAMATRRATGRR